MSDLSLSEQYILYIDLLGYKAKMNEMSEQEFLELIDKLYPKTFSLYYSPERCIILITTPFQKGLRYGTGI